VIDEDHHVHTVVYGAGRYTYDQAALGTRYVLMGQGILIDSACPADLTQVHALQDPVQVSQHDPGRFVTLLDFDERAPIRAFQGPGLLRFAKARSRRNGIITSRQMGAAFTWMRPDDLIFNYWVNNHLMGDKPPAFDILAWKADGTNLPGALHCQFLDIFEGNLLTKPGGLSVLGSPMQLENITALLFVTGAIVDHLTPWLGCYRTTQLLGGDATFVLSYSGHIASLVNPPGNPKAQYWTGAPPGPDPQEWLAGATKHQGSWWEAWAEWVEPHAGEKGRAPETLGNSAHPVLDAAPGRYVCS
jgi:polyhydroxyalkanoate synthase